MTTILNVSKQRDNKSSSSIFQPLSQPNILSNLYRYKEYGKVKNYLYTIAGNTVKNYYKKKKDIPSEELLKSEDCSKNHVEELGVRLTIEQAVRKLPEEIRETAVYIFFRN